MDLSTRAWVSDLVAHKCLASCPLLTNLCTVRKILVDDPEFIFPPSLQQVTLYRSMEGTSEIYNAIAKKKMNVSFQLPSEVLLRQHKSFS